MHYKKDMLLSSAFAKDLKGLCEEPPGLNRVARDEIAHAVTVMFSNGWAMDIKVVATNEPDEDPCWTEAVLLRPTEDGFIVVAFSEPYDSDPLGEWTIGFEGDLYTANIMEKS